KRLAELDRQLVPAVRQPAQGDRSLRVVSCDRGSIPFNLSVVPSEKDLFANFERMRREIDELFGDVFGRSALVRQSGFVPHVDVAYMGDPPTSVVILAELAGVDPSRVALEIRGRRLIIAGERRGQDATGCFYQQVEIEHGPFRREIEPGTAVDADRARATYDNGI